MKKLIALFTIGAFFAIGANAQTAADNKEAAAATGTEVKSDVQNPTAVTKTATATATEKKACAGEQSSKSCSKSGEGKSCCKAKAAAGTADAGEAKKSCSKDGEKKDCCKKKAATTTGS